MSSAAYQRDSDALARWPLSRVISARDYDHPRVAELAREIVPPKEGVHRKAWEFALGVMTLERAGALHDQAYGLSVAAGHEAILYYLTNRARWIIATDIYGVGDFGGREATSSMLSDPDLFAPYPYNRNRLTVCYMDALDLRFEDESFDFVISFGSIEHFGGFEAARKSLEEMGRVLKPGGVAFVTTEIAIDGKGPASVPGLELFTPETIVELVDHTPTLDWFGSRDFSIPNEPHVPEFELGTFHERAPSADECDPHLKINVVLPTGSRVFTSVSLAMRKADG